MNAHKDGVVERRKLDVGLICRVLQVAPSTYYAARGRVPCARALNDVVLSPQLFALGESNFQVEGLRKLWRAARRAGTDIGRGQTERLMKTLELGIFCVLSGRRQGLLIRGRRDTHTSGKECSPLMLLTCVGGAI